MLSRKNTTCHLTALGVLIAGFLLCRYVLFALHGMKQWPEVLFGAGVAVLLISLLAKGELLPWFVSATYPIGFAAGFLFQSNGSDPGGGSTNNFWLIWTIVFVVGLGIGMICEVLRIWHGRNNGG